MMTYASVPHEAQSEAARPRARARPAPRPGAARGAGDHEGPLTMARMIMMAKFKALPLPKNGPKVEVNLKACSPNLVRAGKGKALE